MHPDPVVITGIGFVSCLGTDPTAVAQALARGQSGVVRDPERIARGFRSPLTGALPPLDAKGRLTRKERRAMGEPALYAALAALSALEDAGLPRGAVGGADTGVILGNDSSVSSSWRSVAKAVEEGTTKNLGAGAVVESMNSSPSINLSVLLGTQGACWTVSAACSSGAHAIGQAMGLLLTDQQELVICGGSQELDWSSMAAFDALGAFSVHEGDPAQAARPFSRDRDGLVPSGGGAVLVLERRSRAIRRGARIRAELLSYAFSSDGTHVTSPSGAGAARCMRRALELARVSPGAIEYVHAHAAGTPVGDAVEARAILEVFGPSGPPVSSTKSLTGHECWMAGASEVAYSVLMANGGFLAPNRNFTEADPGLEALAVVREPNRTAARLILKNSFGFGGTNAALVLRG